MKKYFNYTKREIRFFLVGMFLMFLLTANWSDMKRGFMNGWNSVESNTTDTH